MRRVPIRDPDLQSKSVLVVDAVQHQRSSNGKLAVEYYPNIKVIDACISKIDISLKISKIIGIWVYWCSEGRDSLPRST